ncbi:MAG: Thioredoxin-disulfide reductase [Candidatus Peregrinibacteria bacterium GW2011_GWA2_33_10]|nr:MAG: Thioredoxin-disulfide reductase [Candidatus Peregrinibacteria bacterium GW2011_GWA2_33_10]KKP41293.1 MAG: thioredoxin reductase, thioredoxin reductase (NADPH) [Candidatus Peregrinibacteria bacterium GW2011_GWC2_33_13]OGJ49113.1 MAG: thioredoxin-disulfide reductase [Candidatus Peregrinibacteria bacterium RIFOXYA2_FULL_33_7]
MYNSIIIGSGPAGLTAAIYLARADLRPLIIAGIPYGGQLMGTTEIENFPGFENGILGPQLIQNMLSQAKRFGAEVVFENVKNINFQEKPFKINTNKQTYESKTIVIATGAEPRKLGLEGEARLWGKGVSSCATCDGAFYREKIVAVAGGGDSAMEESNFLTKFAKKVYLIHRRDQFRASKIMADRAINNPKIEIIYNTEIKDVLGEDKVEKLLLYNNKTNENSQLPVDGFFLAIGHNPVTGLFKDQLEMKENGYLIKKHNTHSSVEGVFIAGDVEDQRYRQAITAAADGCKAAIDCEKYLSETN